MFRVYHMCISARAAATPTPNRFPFLVPARVKKSKNALDIFYKKMGLREGKFFTLLLNVDSLNLACFENGRCRWTLFEVILVMLTVKGG